MPLGAFDNSTLTNRNIGFTLVELSIVLVIIGLLVGGILVGRDLINAASIRAQISQIEKYQTAVKTFRLKYDGLPGDLTNDIAQACGFYSRGTLAGQGDGNGLITSTDVGTTPFSGENQMFWVDLSAANLVDGSFNNNNIITLPGSLTASQIPQYLPQAKLGNGNYVLAFSPPQTGWLKSISNSNYFSIVAITSYNAMLPATSFNNAVSVSQAFSIDSKIDDGLPQSGRVMAIEGVAGYFVGASDQNIGQPTFLGPTTSGTSGTAATCYDNSTTANGTPGVAGVAQHYSTEMNGGSGFNCALSFRFQ